jgi:hypothetical protein
MCHDACGSGGGISNQGRFQNKWCRLGPGEQIMLIAPKTDALVVEARADSSSR